MNTRASTRRPCRASGYVAMALESAAAKVASANENPWAPATLAAMVPNHEV